MALTLGDNLHEPHPFVKHQTASLDAGPRKTPSNPLQWKFLFFYGDGDTSFFPRSPAAFIKAAFARISPAPKALP